MNVTSITKGEVFFNPTPDTEVAVGLEQFIGVPTELSELVLWIKAQVRLEVLRRCPHCYDNEVVVVVNETVVVPPATEVPTPGEGGSGEEVVPSETPETPETPVETPETPVETPETPVETPEVPVTPVDNSTETEQPTGTVDNSTSNSTEGSNSTSGNQTETETNVTATVYPEGCAAVGEQICCSKSQREACFDADFSTDFFAAGSSMKQQVTDDISTVVTRCGASASVCLRLSLYNKFQLHGTQTTYAFFYFFPEALETLFTELSASGSVVTEEALQAMFAFNFGSLRLFD